ncbi:MAG: AAA family ATPase [Pseudomonadales bacterium]
MKTFDTINRFLQISLHERGKRSAEDESPGIRPFVTISRQAGAGGHTLAEALIKAFAEQEDEDLFGEWQMFDQNLVEMVAASPDLKVSLEGLLSEEYSTRTDDFFRQILSATTAQDMVMLRIFRLVRSLAEVGKVIIVGRAGSQVTQDFGPSVSVRLIAPEEVRLRRMMDQYQLAEKQARALIHKHDTGRARLIKRHFKVNVDDPLLYDVTWNTEEVNLQAIAQAIAAVLRNRAASFHTVERTQ